MPESLELNNNGYTHFTRGLVFLPPEVRGILVLLKVLFEDFLLWCTRPIEVFFRYKFGTRGHSAFQTLQIGLAALCLAGLLGAYDPVLATFALLSAGLSIYHLVEALRWEKYGSPPRYSWSHGEPMPWWTLPARFLQAFGFDLGRLPLAGLVCRFGEPLACLQLALAAYPFSKALGVYLGNQSSSFWVAEGLKKRLVLEACLSCQNCHFGRAGFTYGVNEWTAVPDLDDVSAYTLLTPDRLGVLTASVKEVADLPGDMAEVGVYRGGSARVIVTADPKKTLHLFDTFTGIPADDVTPEGHKAGEFQASLDNVRRYLDGLNVEYHPGFFPDTASGLDDVRYSFVHLDGDLYQTTADALDYFWPRMTPDGIIILGDLD